MLYWEGVDHFAGANYETIGGTTAAECTQLCLDDPACHAFAHQATNGELGFSNGQTEILSPIVSRPFVSFPRFPLLI